MTPVLGWEVNLGRDGDVVPAERDSAAQPGERIRPPLRTLNVPSAKLAKAHVFELRDHKILRLNEYLSRHEALEAAGLSE